MYKEFSLASLILLFRQQEINLDYLNDLLYYKLTCARDRMLYQKAEYCFWSARMASLGAHSRFTEIMGRREKTNFHAFRLHHAQGYISSVAVGSLSAVT